MPYKLSWKNTILEGYRNIVSWENPMSSPIIEENHQKNVLNGNILDSGLAIDPDNPYIGNCWVIYKDQATAEMIFEENSKAFSIVPKQFCKTANAFKLLKPACEKEE